MTGAMKTIFAAAVSAAAAACAEDGRARQLADRETWNRGVDEYRAGDFTNALETLKNLESSKTHRARAAEVLARILHDRAHTPGATAPLDDLEEAARYAQTALRASPSDPKARRNFARTVDGLAELRRTKRANDAAARFKGRDPGSLLRAAMHACRDVMRTIPVARTNTAEAAVAAADSMSAEMSRLEDVWSFAGQAIAAAVTNDSQAAAIGARIEGARKKTSLAVRELGDMESGAYPTVSDVEADATDFFKMTAMPPDALAEDMVAQSNAWLDTAAEFGREWQKEALDYTRSFRASFPAWAAQYEQRAQADTNTPPFSAEAQNEISALSAELEKIQIACVKEPLPPEQEKACGIIARIMELLPKDKSGGQGAQNGGGGAQNGNDNAKSGENDKKNDGDGGRKDELEGKNGENPPQDGGKDDKKDEKPAGGDDRDKGKSPEDREIEAILNKAKERTEEYEAEKKARMRKARLAPGERDW